MSKRIKIILVDDHNIVRQGVKLILEGEEGFEVIGEASDANEAVAKTSEFRPDVIVMDIHLAATDGIEASRRILAAYPATKIVVLSAETAPDTVNRALQSGVSGYVLKEAAGEELICHHHCLDPCAQFQCSDAGHAPPLRSRKGIDPSYHQWTAEQGDRRKAQAQCQVRRGKSLAPDDQDRLQQRGRTRALCRARRPSSTIERFKNGVAAAIQTRHRMLLG